MDICGEFGHFGREATVAGTDSVDVVEGATEHNAEDVIGTVKSEPGIGENLDNNIASGSEDGGRFSDETRGEGAARENGKLGEIFEFLGGEKTFGGTDEWLVVGDKEEKFVNLGAGGSGEDVDCGGISGGKEGLVGVFNGVKICNSVAVVS